MEWETWERAIGNQHLKFGIGFGYWKMEIVVKILENGNIGYRQCKYWIVLDAILIVKQFLISIMDPPELFIEPRVFFFNANDLNINLFVRKYLGHFSNIFLVFNTFACGNTTFTQGRDAFSVLVRLCWTNSAWTFFKCMQNIS